MAITTLDGLVSAMGSAQQIQIIKPTITSQVAGGWSSFWRSNGSPMSGVIPTSTANAVCDINTSGAIKYTSNNATEQYLSKVVMSNSTNAYAQLYLVDRLANCAQLGGTFLTAQSCSVDCTVPQLSTRIGDSNYSKCLYFLEWYVATGSIAANATVQYVNHLNVSGINAQVIAVAVNTAASRMYQIIPANGDFISKITQVTLSASTGAAGNFGVTACRVIASMPISFAINQGTVVDWQTLGLPRIYPSGCLQFIQQCVTTTTGILTGNIQIVTG